MQKGRLMIKILCLVRNMYCSINCLYLCINHLLLSELFHNYMIARVQTGQGKRVHEETGVVSRISISTLWRLSYDLFFLVCGVEIG